jgi:hypothetical protein
MPRPLYSRKKIPLFPLDRRLGGPQNRPGRRGEEKHLVSTGTELRPPRVSTAVAIPTVLAYEYSHLFKIFATISIFIFFRNVGFINY